MSKDVRQPRNPIDFYVGQKVRFYRLKKGWSQTQLGDALKLTFQQVQKYEKGTNRVGSGRLLDIANILDQPVTAFFPKNGGPLDDELGAMELINQPSTMRLLEAWRTIPSEAIRTTISQLVRAIADETGVHP